MRKTLLLIIILLISWIYPLPTKAVLNANDSTTNNKQMEIDLSTSPHKVLFILSNLKPGDQASRVLTVNNNGKQDFNYLFSNKFLTGSEKFYNQLLLKVTDSNGTLYEGKLKDFNKLDTRSLVSGMSEKLFFTVEIPYELGNEYQGLSSEFQFKLYVEGTLGGVLPADGPQLPNTATGIFNLMAIGVALIIGGFTLMSFVKKKQQDIKPI